MNTGIIIFLLLSVIWINFTKKNDCVIKFIQVINAQEITLFLKTGNLQFYFEKNNNLSH
jgi:hypothetical protein